MRRTATMRHATLLLAATLLTACGVGAVEETYFGYEPLTASGGSIEVGDITLVIPPGALSETTAVAVLPEDTPLALEVPTRDPCTYALLGPEWCCSPRGLLLDPPAHLTVSYDESLVPAGAREQDLLLCLWDERAQVLRPAPETVQDLEANTLTIEAYAELGHVAIALATCPPFGFVFQAVRPTPSSITGLIADERVNHLYVVETVDAAPVLLPAPDVRLDVFLPSPDGTRVLYEATAFDEASESRPRRSLFGVDVDGASDPLLLAGTDETISGYDPLVGWLDATGDVFFQERTAGGGDITGLVDALPLERIDRVPADGSAPAAELYPLGPYAYADDLRQSPDGSLVLVRFYGSQEERQIDVFDAVTGVPYSQGLIPPGGGEFSPRFLPDSSGVYLVDDDGASVRQYAPDGTNETILFELPAGYARLRDFVLAPNGDDFAFVGVPAFADEIAIVASETLVVGSLSAGPRASTPLSAFDYYEELVFHPDGEYLFLDTYFENVRIFLTADAASGPTLPAPFLSLVDISEVSGELLVIVPPQQAIENGTLPSATLTPGLYAAAADGSELRRLETPEDLDVVQARWLRTVRRAPGMFFVNTIR